jgi:hypothetical protein
VLSAAVAFSPKTSVIYRRPRSAAREELENPRGSWKNAGWVRSASLHPSEGFEGFDRGMM